jgi:hypothetical protein
VPHADRKVLLQKRQEIGIQKKIGGGFGIIKVIDSFLILL